MKSVYITLLPTYVQRTTALHVHVGVINNERIMTHLLDALRTYAAYLKRRLRTCNFLWETSLHVTVRSV